jgi:predicted HTH domain antitoxin
MYQVTINIPEETTVALKTNPEKLGEEMKLITAIKLYELGRLSSGAAAKMAGIPKVIFLSKLGDYGVNTFDLTEEELQEDLANA